MQKFNKNKFENLKIGIEIKINNNHIYYIIYTIKLQFNKNENLIVIVTDIFKLISIFLQKFMFIKQ